ncbi:hypothetical protein O181_007111 [Austropuccinia psidii MF-1]|uniref:CCHC-type domain-containing protein n=1 Tax=Austropuccinia psidii MF-1 TaxID=1389203 RepID=A0A9Q3GHC0_9BASI|nr:hypothetical protein [Austropuccinia psidii MF-1]
MPELPHSPRSVPTMFDINSEPELIQGNVLRAESFPSGSNRNISVPVQTLVQSSQGRGVGNIPKPLEGAYELLPIHKDISRSGEDHSNLRMMESIVLQRQDEKKELEMTPTLEKESPVASTSFKPAPEVSKDKPKIPQKKQRRTMSNKGKGKGKANWHRPYPQGYRIPIGAFSHGQSSYGIPSQGAGKDEQDSSMKIIDEIKHIKSIIDVKLGEIEHAINCRCVEPYSTEDYINAKEDIITRQRSSKTWTRSPIESKLVPKISREDKRPERPVFKCHKCGRNSHLAKNCTKKTKINEVQVIEEVQCAVEIEESDQDCAISEETPVENYPFC